MLPSFIGSVGDQNQEGHLHLLSEMYLSILKALIRIVRPADFAGLWSATILLQETSILNGATNKERQIQAIQS